MKILHTADWHIGNFPGPEKDGRNLRADDTGMCIQHLHDIALLEKPQMVLVSGDIFHQARVWADRGLHEVEVAIRALTALSKICPVVVVRGTPNHDGSEQFSMLDAHFSGDDSVHIITEPTVFQVKGYKITDRWVNIACLPGFDRGIFRAKFPGLSKEEENVVFTEELGKTILALRAECDPRYPSVLMSHYTVPGCNTESGQTQFLTQFEPVLLPEMLDAASFGLVALGHIHRPQMIPTCKNTFYSGAINALNFNDEGQDRGFLIHEFPDDGSAVQHTFIKTPAREFLTLRFVQADIEAINDGALEYVAENRWRWNNSVAGKIVRVLYTCTEDAHKAFNRSLLEKQLYADGAFWVSEISPEQVTVGTNKDELSEKTDPEKNLRLYLDEKGLPDADVGEIVETARPIIGAATASTLSSQFTGAFVPVSIEVKNYRNYAEATFDFSDISFCTINGVNGAGKSSLFMDAILDCLFEEPREGDLTGWIRADEKARSGSICFTFSIGEHIFRVTRTRAKSGKATLNVAEKINGEWQNRSAEKIKDTQTLIENILGMDSLTFRSCALIMQDQYGLFLQASKEDRMSILGNILGLGVYGEMERIAKNCLADVNRSIAQGKTVIATLAQGLDQAERLESDYVNLQETIEILQKHIDNCSARKDVLSAKLATAAQARDRGKKIESSLGDLSTKKTALRQSAEDCGRAIYDAERVLQCEQIICEGAAAHPDNLEEEKRLLAVKAALKVKADAVAGLPAEYRNCEAELRDLEKHLADITSHKAALVERYETALRHETAAQELAETRRYIEDAENTESVFRELSAKLQSLQTEYQGQKATFTAEGAARKERIASLTAKAQMLADSRCVDVENATCRFLADAKAAAAALEQYRPECTAWKEERLAELETLSSQIAGVKEALDGIGYNPSQLMDARRKAENLRKDAEEYDRRTIYSDMVASADAQIKRTSADLAKMQERIAGLKSELSAVSDISEQMVENEKAIAAVRAKVAESAMWLEKKNALPLARERKATAEKRSTEISAEITAVDTQMAELLVEKDQLEQRTAGYDDLCSQMATVDAAIDSKRKAQAITQSDIGAIREKLDRIEERRTEIAEKQAESVRLAHKAAVYDTLKSAFSQDGIPHNIIRSMLPILTSTANTILGQMTGGKMGMEFITDKVLKSNSKKEVPTLDIIINEYGKDSLPYLSKSGGEKVKASLSAILSLAEIKSSQAGIQLGMLFIDEPPFLDADGIQAYCDALETIQARYSGLKVMAITHDPTMKARFPQSIDVIKTPDGSRIDVG